MKDLLSLGAGRNALLKRRFILAVLFSLAPAAASVSLSAAENKATASPAGESRLSWVKPEDNANKDGETVLMFDDSAFEEEATEPTPLKVASKSPIKPVNLIQDDGDVISVPNLPEEGLADAERSYQNQGRITVPTLPQANYSSDAYAEGTMNAEKRADENYADECPDPKKLSSILDLSYKVIPEPGLFPESCPLPDEFYVRKAPTPITFTWKASCLCHKPLYFEDVQLERYGHSICPLLQPALSGARFWLTIPALPYFIGVNPPNECIYELGYYRPGNCAPNMLNPVPISVRGGLMEAGAVVGVAYLIP